LRARADDPATPGSQRGPSAVYAFDLQGMKPGKVAATQRTEKVDRRQGCMQGNEIFTA